MSLSKMYDWHYWKLIGFCDDDSYVYIAIDVFKKCLLIKFDCSNIPNYVVMELTKEQLTQIARNNKEISNGLMMKFDETNGVKNHILFNNQGQFIPLKVHHLDGFVCEIPRLLRMMNSLSES